MRRLKGQALLEGYRTGLVSQDNDGSTTFSEKITMIENALKVLEKRTREALEKLSELAKWIQAVERVSEETRKTYDQVVLGVKQLEKRLVDIEHSLSFLRARDRTGSKPSDTGARDLEEERQKKRAAKQKLREAAKAAEPGDPTKKPN